MTFALPDGKLWKGLEILVVSPTPTHPQDHGNRKRIFEICSELQRQGAAIHFVHYAAEHDWRNARPAAHERDMVAAWDSYQLVAPSRPLHDLSIGPDHLIDEWSDPALTGYISWAFKVRTYDVVLVEYTWMSFCFNAVPGGVFKICDTHDVFGGRRKVLEKIGISPEFFYTTPEEEKKGLSRADLVWAIKESEREYFKSELGINGSVTLLYSEPARGWWVSPPSRDGWLRVGVMGAKNNVNRRNLESFIAAALPVFESYMAPIKLVIAGGCSEDFMDVRHPNLEVLGRVPEVDGFYRSMDVICAPIQFSTGLKIKVAEALASGAPVVAHAHAMEGYPTNHALHNLPDFHAMARELVKLAFEPSGLRSLATKSAATTQKIQAQVIQALEQTRLQIIASRTGGIVIVASLEALDKRSLLFDHLFSALNYLRFAGPTTLYLVGQARQFDQGLLRNFGFPFGVFVEPGLAEALSDALPEEWRRLDLMSVLKNLGIQRGYFLASDRQVEDIWPGMLSRAYVRYDAVALLGQDPAALARILAHVSSVVIVSATQVRLRNEDIASTCQVPFRRKNAYVSFAHRARESAVRGGMLVIADKENLLAQMLKALAARLGFPVVVLEISDPSMIREMTLPSIGHNPRVNVAGARLIVDISSGSAICGVIAEGARRAGVPVISFARGTSALALQRSNPLTKAVTIAALMRKAAGGLIEGAARQKLVAAAQAEAANLMTNDSGWAWIWQDLMKISAPAGTKSAADALLT